VSLKAPQLVPAAVSTAKEDCETLLRHRFSPQEKRLRLQQMIAMPRQPRAAASMVGKRTELREHVPGTSLRLSGPRRLTLRQATSKPTELIGGEWGSPADSWTLENQLLRFLRSSFAMFCRRVDQCLLRATSAPSPGTLVRPLPGAFLPFGQRSLSAHLSCSASSGGTSLQGG
jgi:hypothetical protein